MPNKVKQQPAHTWPPHPTTTCPNVEWEEKQAPPGIDKEDDEAFFGDFVAHSRKEKRKVVIQDKENNPSTVTNWRPWNVPQQQNVAANEANKEQRIREVVEMLTGGDAEYRTAAKTNLWRVSMESHRELFWMTTIMWNATIKVVGIPPSFPATSKMGALFRYLVGFGTRFVTVPELEPGAGVIYFHSTWIVLANYCVANAAVQTLLGPTLAIAGSWEPVLNMQISITKFLGEMPMRRTKLIGAIKAPSTRFESAQLGVLNSWLISPI
ncbi:hypothetical protein GGX14DRAFT_404956 [Mycena pura]|uniref:Uncharacterized protein n=1 Tax=Mycena pura TaxID=153505 RepID=A0AAD6UT22_9AGAR|nr:hypothetical protein GGX14DRAFT_404956 [Mycena pura]